MKLKNQLEKVSYLLFLSPIAYSGRSQIVPKAYGGSQVKRQLHVPEESRAVSQHSNTMLRAEKNSHIRHHKDEVEVRKNFSRVNVEKSKLSNQSRIRILPATETNIFLNFATEQVAKESTINSSFMQIFIIIALMVASFSLFMLDRNIQISLTSKEAESNDTKNTQKDSEEQDNKNIVTINRNYYAIYFIFMSLAVLLGNMPWMHHMISYVLIATISSLIVYSSVESKSWGNWVIIVSHALLSVMLMNAVNKKDVNVKGLRRIANVNTNPVQPAINPVHSLMNN